MEGQKGTLYIVATPIGNMGDITLRALEVLKEADVVASEDTRTTGMMLKKLGISKPQMSFHAFNEEAAVIRIATELEAGRDVALVSDAGTPGISDPGYSIIKLAADMGFTVTMAPGPSALIMAGVLSGLPVSSFTFRGFPPRTASKRRRFFSEDALSPHTLIYYESPHRLRACLDDMLFALGDRRIALCNDLTKKFESITRCIISDAICLIAGEQPLLGEYVIVVEGAHTEEQRKPKRNKYKPEGDANGG